MEGWGKLQIQKRRKSYFARYTNFFIIDIETIKDKSMLDDVASEEELKKAENGEFLPAPFHQVVAISYMIVKNRKILDYKSVASKDEFKLINTFWTNFAKSHSGKDGKIFRFPVLITFNGKDFDIPVLKIRTLKYIPYLDHKYFVSIFFDRFDKWEDNYPTYGNRYSNYHIDLATDFFGKKVSLKKLCYLCGIPVKTEGDGSQVENWFYEDNLHKIATYCAEDVLAIAKLFSYINQHLLANSYLFPLIDEFENLEADISIE